MQISRRLVSVALAILGIVVSQSTAVDNGVGLTPIMGFNTWNQFACDINEDLIKEITVAMVNEGLRDLGYQFVNIDDCWQAPTRDADGYIRPDPKRFPSGMKALAEFVHSHGMKLGIYSDVGYTTCQGFPGSYDHFDKDAATYAGWKIDLLKFDFCDRTLFELLDPAYYYGQMSEALNNTGRPIVFSICEWGWQNPWQWAGNISNMWRTTLDISAWWPRVLQIADTNKQLARYAGPGHFNDPDMLEVGVTSSTALNQDESQSHFGMWAMMASPLILGNDIRNMSAWVKNIITNPEVIAINQDPLGKQSQVVDVVSSGLSIDGYCLLFTCTNTETWVKQLSNNSVAVLFWNRAWDYATKSSSFHAENITVTWNKLGFQEGEKILVRDLWARENIGVFENSYTAVSIPQHGSGLFSFTPFIRSKRPSSHKRP